MRPLIGVMPLFDDQRDSYWMLPGYMKAVEAAGGLPIMLPLTTDTAQLNQLLDSCDGILLTGGQDVNPASYGEAMLSTCGAICQERDEMECHLLDGAIRLKKPILGICRGLQLMNAHLGGTLYQDLPSQYGTTVSHTMKPPYNRVAHQVLLVAGTLLHKLLGVESLGVNSYHHQAIRELAPPLTAAAISQDGLIEAVYLADHPCALAVQWHPEFSYETDTACQKIMRYFVAVCER